MADILLSPAAARERAAQETLAEELALATEHAGDLATSTAPEIVQVTTAFLVLWINGEVIVSADLDATVVTDHNPTADEILGAAGVLVADRTAERTAGLAAEIIPHVTAEATVTLIQQKQEAAMAAMQAARDKALGEQLLANGRN